MSTSYKVQEDQRIADAREPAGAEVRTDEVDRASIDSFPASDPPSWNGVRLGSPRDTCDSIGNPEDGR
jgi:hypothetical protein